MFEPTFSLNAYKGRRADHFEKGDSFFLGETLIGGIKIWVTTSYPSLGSETGFKTTEGISVVFGWVLSHVSLKNT